MKRLVITLISAIVAILVMPAQVASAAPANGITATFVEEGAGLSAAYGPDGARKNVVLQILQIDGKQVVVYCVDINTAFDDSATFHPTSFDAVQNPEKAAFVATKGGSIGTPLVNADFEAIARQIAIWHFTNGASLDPSYSTPEIMNRATELVADAAAVIPSAAPVNLSVSGKRIDGTATVTAKVTDQNDKPVQKLSIQITVGSVTQNAVTDGSGEATIVVTGTDATSATAKLATSLSAGTILRPTTNSQLVMTSTSVDIAKSASAGLEVTKSPAATPTTTVVPTTTTTIPAPVKELPYTGQKDNLLVLLGLLFLVGAGSFAWIRHNTSK